jgi:hypothetical protein
MLRGWYNSYCSVSMIDTQIGSCLNRLKLCLLARNRLPCTVATSFCPLKTLVTDVRAGRSKGLTETSLAQLGYSDTIAFRPGFLAGCPSYRPAQMAILCVMSPISCPNTFSHGRAGQS